MKKLLSITFLCFAGFMLQAQTIFLTEQNYEQLKNSNKLDKKINYQILPQTPMSHPGADVGPSKEVIQNSNSQLAAKTSSTGACQCMVPVDPTFTVVPFTIGTSPDYRNDDGSSPLVNLGFNFCFYGTNQTSCYINTNGNISFGSAYSTFSSNSFPDPSFVMIAPFWGDVDTRGAASGLVYYKVTPTYMIVKWENVGYYSQHTDKLNTFQLIITNGSDPIIPNGNNIAFCYGDMQWTTGDASSGTGGFGGTPSTVGVNKGDGTNYIQIGRFDAPGTNYDGPYGANDQVSFLDYKSYFFNSCGTNNNLPPILQDASGGASVCGDTISICALGDTLVYTTSFLGPENNQTVSVVGSAPTLGGNFVPLGVTSTAGGVTTYAWMVTTNGAPAGTHLVTVTGTDNGVPNLSTTAYYYIKILNIAVPQPSLSVAPAGTVCATPGATLTLTNCANYDNVYWSNGSTGCSIVVSQSGQYFVSVKKTGCFKSAADSVTVYPNPTPTLSGGFNYCNGLGTLISVNTPTSGAAYSTYTWTPNGTVHTYSDNITSPGNYTVTVTDTNGCKGSKTFTISSAAPSVSVTQNPASACGVSSVTLTASTPNATYSWSPNGETTQTVVATTAGVYNVTVTVNTCTATTSYTVNFPQAPTVSISPNPAAICNGLTATLTAVTNPPGVYNYGWSNGGGNNPSVTVSSVGVVQVTVTNSLNCVATATTMVQALANPTVSFATNPVEFCNGSSALLSPVVTTTNTPITYSWTPASLTGPTPTVNAPGVVTVTVTAGGCKGTASVTVNKITPVVSFANTDTLLCPGECTSIVANGSSTTPVTYSWSPVTSTSNTVSVCQTGIYVVTVTDQKGCTASNGIHIGADVIPVASFYGNPPSPVVPGQVINFTNTSTVSSGSITASDWSFGDGIGTSTVMNPAYAYGTVGNFPVILIVTSSNGCKDTAVVNYDVQAVLEIPNVFTPNGDGVNDFLKFKNLEFYGSSHIAIYNRWGKKIFEQDNYKNDWNGGGYSDGTYFFILTVPNGLPKDHFEGYFQIFK
ncbi:MAG: gliding motility-associated C-terminal domain-containing protein [Bacteroidetes bacterium]|nr:gliding motility-associated C-terminal domain-containing protein [Bacteroidota bacterium]